MAKKSSFDIIAKNFLKDNLAGVTKHIFVDVLIPKTGDYLKEAAYYAVTETAKNLIFQGKNPSGIAGSFDFSGKNGAQNSNRMVEQNKNQFRKRIDYDRIKIVPDRNNFGIITKTAREKYDYVMNEIRNSFESSGRLRVLDLYNILGVSGTYENDANSGWYSLDGYNTTIDHNGDIILHLPTPRQF